MLTSASAHLSVVEPHGPDAPLIPGLTASTRLTSAETGSISIVEHLFSPGALVPPHRHTLEDEISYVVMGDIGFRSNGQEVTLAAGGYIVKPRGELHSRSTSSNWPRRSRRRADFPTRRPWAPLPGATASRSICQRCRSSSPGTASSRPAAGLGKPRADEITDKVDTFRSGL